MQFLAHLRARDDLSTIPVLFLTARGMTDDRIQGYRAGVNAYLPKPFDPEELVSIVDNMIVLADRAKAQAKAEAEAVEKALEYEEKRRVAAVAEMAVLEGRTAAIRDNLKKVQEEVGLTQREEQVLGLLCRGRTNREISVELDLGVRGVEKHVTNLLSKTGTKNRTELVQFAFERGLRGGGDRESRQEEER